MKALKLKSFLLVLIVAFALTGCANDQIIDETDEFNIELDKSINSSKQSEQEAIAGPEYSNNELVIQYANHITTERQKQAVRNRHNVVSYERCNCDIDSIELWRFSEDDGIDIEEREEAARDDEDIDLEEFNYYIPLGEDDTFVNPQPNPLLLANLTNFESSNITIAVLDTGVDYTNPLFSTPFLHHIEDIDRCKYETVYDDFDYSNNPNANLMDTQGHGTEVTGIIYKILVDKGVKFDILPIKVFDEDGKTSSFKITCGLQFARDNNVDIINTSFGWYRTPIDFIRQEYQNSHGTEQILTVASAGNSGINTDSDDFAHYPSNQGYNHIISVAGLNEESNGLWKYSNYGRAMTHVTAKAVNIESIVNPGTYISGTSFSAPIVTARASILFTEGVLVQDALFTSVVNSGIPLNSLEGYIKYPVYIDGLND